MAVEPQGSLRDAVLQTCSYCLDKVSLPLLPEVLPWWFRVALVNGTLLVGGFTQALHVGRSTRLLSYKRQGDQRIRLSRVCTELCRRA